MIALTTALIIVLLTRRPCENKAELMRRWAAYTWWIAAVIVLYYMAMEGYALVEMAALNKYSSVIATLSGLLYEAVLVRGAWADFASGAVLWILAAMLDELNIDVKQRRARALRKKYCFVVWRHEEA